MAVIILVFLYPIWRAARSRGYDARPFVAVPAAVAFVGVSLDVVFRETPLPSPWSELILLAEIGVPAATLVLVHLLRPRAGAPGKEWLTIRFPCPYCRQDITFRRELEGLVRECPECGEIVTVSETPAQG